jgi:hypothetical protein
MPYARRVPHVTEKGYILLHLLSEAIASISFRDPKESNRQIG